jgi:hypothetical protein
MTEQESNDPASGDKLSVEARAIAARIKIERELLTQRLTKMGRDANKRRSEERVRAAASGFVYGGTVREVVEQNARERERDRQIAALEGEAKLQELEVELARAIEKANSQKSAGTTMQKPTSNAGRPNNLGRPPEPFWAEVLGWAAGWLAAYDEPAVAAEAALVRVMADKAAERDKHPGETQLKLYAEGLLKGFREHMKRE